MNRLPMLFVIGCVEITLVMLGAAGCTTLGRNDAPKLFTDAPMLLSLARKEFGKLTPAEEYLLEATATGSVANYSTKLQKDKESHRSEKFDAQNVLRAGVVSWLCTDQLAQALVTEQGIQVKGALIKGGLNLNGAKIPFPLDFSESAFPERIYLFHAELNSLSLVGTKTGAINGGGIEVKGNVNLSDGFEAHGEVDLTGATIDGQLNCTNGHFINHSGKAICGQQLEVKQPVFLSEGFKAEGEVDLLGASILALNCDNGQFISPGGTALYAYQMKIKSNISFGNGFKADGEVNLNGGIVDGDLICRNAQFINPLGIALSANGIQVKGSVIFIEGCKSEGEVSLIGARVGQQLRCKNSQFSNPYGTALYADLIDVKSGMFLSEGFKAEGEVRLNAAVIGKQFVCVGARFINPLGIALSADAVRVEGSILLMNGFIADGDVTLQGASINSDLFCKDAHFAGDMSLSTANIKDTFVWIDIVSPEDTMLDLRSARTKTLLDEEKSWPEEGKLRLYGFIYQEIHNKAPLKVNKRIKWLQLQDTPFQSQPYEQLAEVFSNAGRNEDARKVLVAKNKERIRETEMPAYERFLYWLLGQTIGFGYYPWRAFWIGLLVVGIGCSLFQKGFRQGLMASVEEKATKAGREDLQFNAFVYSLDVFVPLIKLRQADHWLPSANIAEEITNLRWLRWQTGGLLCIYFWFHTVAGWLLTTLLVLGLAGLVRP